MEAHTLTHSLKHTHVSPANILLLWFPLSTPPPTPPRRFNESFFLYFVYFFLFLLFAVSFFDERRKIK